MTMPTLGKKGVKGIESPMIQTGKDEPLTQKKGCIVKGIPLSPGIVEGLVHTHRNILGPIDVPADIKRHDIEEEFYRLDEATTKVSDDLCALAVRVEEQVDARLASIFGIHKLIVEDTSLRNELKREIEDNLVTASSAVKTVFLRWEKRFLLMDSQISRDKGEDMKDVSIRLSNALAGITVHPLDEIPQHSVLAISRLLPSDTVFLSGRSISAVLLEYGSYGSHASLFLREMGIPCISGISGIQSLFSEEDPALVNADEGTVIIRPMEKQIRIFRGKMDENRQNREIVRLKAAGPAVTEDGLRISVLANVGCPEDTERAMENGADGIGLYRMERAYLGRIAPPKVSELLSEMRQTLSSAKGLPVNVRLLDLGSDKQLAFMSFLAESNPALGQRGIRLLLKYPELLKTNMRALLQLSLEFDIRILVPMVSLPEEMARVREILDRLCSEENMASPPPLGAMIETPAAALSAKLIGEYADFLSFGTNDLTQYSYAADRENGAVETYFNDSSQVIFRLIGLTRGDVPDMPLSVCGELAGQPQNVEKLLSCGIETLSVAPPLIPLIKEAVRHSRLQKPSVGLV